MTTAYLLAEDEASNTKRIQLDNHIFELRLDSTPYCAGHKSFECWDELEEEDLDAINNPEVIK